MPIGYGHNEYRLATTVKVYSGLSGSITLIGPMGLYHWEFQRPPHPLLAFGSHIIISGVIIVDIILKCIYA